jgi:gas vesicle protein
MHQEDTRESRHYGFIVGMAAGTIVGAGLMMWLTPRSAAELRQRVRDTARGFGQQASDHLQQTSARVGEAVDQITRTGQSVRNDVAGAFARGAHEVERFAKAAAADGV